MLLDPRRLSWWPLSDMDESRVRLVNKNTFIWFHRNSHLTQKRTYRCYSPEWHQQLSRDIILTKMAHEIQPKADSCSSYVELNLRRGGGERVRDKQPSSTTLRDHAAPWKWVLILLGPGSFRRLMWVVVELHGAPRRTRGSAQWDGRARAAYQRLGMEGVGWGGATFAHPATTHISLCHLSRQLRESAGCWGVRGVGKKTGGRQESEK